ncbi:MAG: hypothetical protein KF814_08095 [Nitrospiraceae bacterium]|nr:hypothetical protein [Nitrospiraceae bacterium]
MASAQSLEQHTQAGPTRPARSMAPPAPAEPARGLGARPLLLLCCLFVLSAFQVAVGKYYTPRSTVGFTLGVVGTFLMVALLAYPLRKHLKWMQRWGALKHWFRVHMILGLTGPALILFHSTFHIRSPNAAVALVSMLIVVISGVVGRFVYGQIHFGLYGSRATLETLQTSLDGRSEETASRFHFAPRVEQWLLNFRRDASQEERGLLAGTVCLVTTWFHRHILARRCARELRRILRTNRQPEFRGGEAEAVELVHRYLREVERVAQFTTYERLFSLWHVLHIPLIYLLAASTIFHVIAVYMY